MQRLKLGEGAAELAALLQISDRAIKTGPSRSERTGPDVETAAVKACHGNGKPLPLLADPVGNGNAAIGEIHLRGGLALPAELHFLSPERKARRVLFHDKTRDTLGSLASGADHDDIDIGHAAARDERLGPVQHIVIAVDLGAGPQACRIRTRSRFGETVACEMLHGAKRRRKRLRCSSLPKRSIIHAAMLWIEI